MVNRVKGRSTLPFIWITALFLDLNISFSLQIKERLVWASHADIYNFAFGLAIWGTPPSDKEMKFKTSMRSCSSAMYTRECEALVLNIFIQTDVVLIAYRSGRWIYDGALRKLTPRAISIATP